MRQKAFYLGLVFLIISTSGCVYLRLLQVKRQLSDFNSYFQIKEENGLTLVFLKPILLTDDMVWLMKSPPLSKKKTERGEFWEYVLQKQYPGSKNEEGNFDIPISMVFQNDRLSQISLPERFLKYLSKPLLVKMMRSMGDAEINKSERSAGSRFKTKNSLEIPRRQHVVYILGKPFSTQDSDNTSNFTYIYNLKEEEPKAGNNRFKLVMKFTFQKGDHRLLKAETDLRGLKMSLDFSFDEKDKDTADSKKR